LLKSKLANTPITTPIPPAIIMYSNCT
jgi:hypothetical protein